MTIATEHEKFHIHIDAASVHPDFRTLLLGRLGFTEKNFVRDGRRGSEYSPSLHLTKKFWSKLDFDSDFDAIDREIARGDRFIGYIEGEFIASRDLFPTRAARGDAPPPFRIQHAPVPKGSFRQTEIHLTIDEDGSDPAVIDAFFEMGFFCAYARKPRGLTQILTMQGSLTDIRAIKAAVARFIVARGGLAGAKMMEERIIRWRTSSDQVELPPVVGKIEWSAASLRDALAVGNSAPLTVA